MLRPPFNFHSLVWGREPHTCPDCGSRCLERQGQPCSGWCPPGHASPCALDLDPGALATVSDYGGRCAGPDFCMWLSGSPGRMDPCIECSRKTHATPVSGCPSAAKAVPWSVPLSSSSLGFPQPRKSFCRQPTRFPLQRFCRS